MTTLWLYNGKTRVYNTKCEEVHRVLGNNQSAIVSKSVVISNYTQYMSGVDTADHFCGSYAFLRKTRKWWCKMFFWLMEVAIVNNYMLYNMNRKQNGSKDIRHKMFLKNLLYSW